ncbi:MAG: xanthine dehydrogenase family protein molybdopterin-binding subunit [Burkholderiales bacterium]|nr:xanthine dehydrogenase family protein molybdopterin-binding subunit [Burkholderiales bacterium]
MKRRTFLLTGAGIAGTLVVGWAVRPPATRLVAEAASLPLERGDVQLNGWLTISPEGLVTVAVPRAEMGQGVLTALPMLLAEELGCDWAAVRTAAAPIDRIYGNVEMLVDGLPFHPDEKGRAHAAGAWVVRKIGRELGLMVTGGSSSVKDAWGPLRIAGASAREMLVAAAAARFRVDPSTCRVERGWVRHASGLQASFGELAAAAAQIEPNRFPVLKSAEAFTIIGKSLPRTDVPAKVTGAARFGTDVRLPDMLHAAIRMAPAFGGDWIKFAANGAEGMPGVKAVLPVSSRAAGAARGIAVVATTWWQAKRAVDALDITWDAGPHGGMESAIIATRMREALDARRGAAYRAKGAMAAAFARANRIVEAEYAVPFLAHATMEPQNCTARVADGKVEVWVPTQAPSLVRWIAARTAGVTGHDVTVHPTLLGGGFGRRAELDLVVQAVEIARSTGGRPVQLVWSREEDMAHDMYRPAAIARLRGGVDSDGRVVAWEHFGASGSVMHSMVERIGFAPMGPDKTNAEGAADVPYEFANHKVEHALVKSAVPLGFWRSVGHSQNAYFTEAFMDELAAAAGKDPYQFRRALLAGHPRHLAVLDLAAARAGWDKPPAAGIARGIALAESFGSIVAQVAEVSLVKGEKGMAPRVHRVVCAIDCGQVIHPDIVAAQMESGVIFGLSAALFGEITVKGGAVEQRNFPDYPMVRMAGAPVVETHIVPSKAPPGGVGEPGTPPIAPAVANAVFKLTGKPVRSLPIRLA